MARAVIVAAAATAAVLALGSAFTVPPMARGPATEYQMLRAQQPTMESPAAGAGSLLSMGAIVGLAFGLMVNMTPASAVVAADEATKTAFGDPFTPATSTPGWVLKRDKLEAAGKEATELASTLESKLNIEIKVANPMRPSQVKFSDAEFEPPYNPS